MPKNYFKISVIACATITLMGGCAVSLQPLERSDLLQTLRLDRLAAQKNVEALNSDLTIEEAIARGVKYNLDHRVRMMERSVAMGQFDLSRYDMLPKMMANAGYSTRDKPNQNTNLPDSSDQDINTSSLSLSWNLLDFGMSYYSAKQNADRALVAAEKRRKAMHILIQDIQTAFLRAASAQKLRQDIVEVINLGDEALQDALKVEKENLRKPLEVLRYQKNLLDNLRVLESINQELSSAEIELVTLLNLPTGTKIKIKEPSFEIFFKGIDQISIDDLEVLALSNNADIKESVYNSRIAVEETKKSILKILPGISFNYGDNYTSNSYTVNKNWMEGAGQINFNLFNILTAPKVFAQGDAEKELAMQRRMAMQMAILGQVHLANQQLENAKRLHKRSENIARVDGRISTIALASEKQGTLSKAELVSAQSSHIVSQLRKYQSLSQLYAASGRLQSTLGYEPDFGDIQSTSLQALTETVTRSMGDWNSGNIIKNSIKKIDVVSQPSISQTSVELTSASKTVSNVTKPDVLSGVAIATVTEGAKEVSVTPLVKEATVKEKTTSNISDVKAIESPISESPRQVSDASTSTVEKSSAPIVDKSNTDVLLDSNVDSKSIALSSPKKVNLQSFKINQPASASLNNMSWTLPTNGIDWSSSSKAEHIVNGQLIWGAKSSTGRTIKIVWRTNNIQEKSNSIHNWQGQIPLNPSLKSWEILRLEALRDLAQFLNKERDQNLSINQQESPIGKSESKKIDELSSKTIASKTDAVIESQPINIAPIIMAEEAKVAAAKAEEVRIAELKAEETKAAAAKAEEARIAELKAEETKAAAAKAEEARIAELKAEEAKVAAAKAEEARIAELKVEEAKVAAAKAEEARIAELKVEETKVAAAKAEEARIADLKAEEAKVAAAKTEEVIKLHLKSFKVNQPAAKSVNNMSWTLPVKSIKWINSKEADYHVQGTLAWGPKSTGDRAIKVSWTVLNPQSGKNINHDWNGFITKTPKQSDWESLRVDALEDLASYLSKQ